MAEATDSEENKHHWPEPLLENFEEEWPNFQAEDSEIETSAINSKKIMMRVVTWNLCARPPPPSSQLTRLVMPKNKYYVHCNTYNHHQLILYITNYQISCICDRL